MNDGDYYNDMDDDSHNGNDIWRVMKLIMMVFVVLGVTAALFCVSCQVWKQCGLRESRSSPSSKHRQSPGKDHHVIAYQVHVNGSSRWWSAGREELKGQEGEKEQEEKYVKK